MTLLLITKDLVMILSWEVEKYCSSIMMLETNASKFCLKIKLLAWIKAEVLPLFLVILAEIQRTSCQPREVCVEVTKEYPESTSHFYAPRCVSLHRCGGCCTNEAFYCTNTSYTLVNKTVSHTAVCLKKRVMQDTPLYPNTPYWRGDALWLQLDIRNSSCSNVLSCSINSHGFYTPTRRTRQNCR